MSRHLALEISDSKLRFKVFSSGEPGTTHEIELHYRTAEERKQLLDDGLKSMLSDSSAFDEVSAGIVSKQSTLVPTSVFADSKAEDIYKLCFGATSDQHSSDYNRIPEHSLVNVYGQSNWIKSYFVLKFPRIVIQHSGSHLVRLALDSNNFKPKVTVALFDGYFHMTIVKHSKLEYYSSFDCENAEDVIYHLYFVLQQKEMVQETGSILLSAGSNQALAENVLQGLNRIADLKNYSKTVENDLHLKAQLLCV
jgi:hypothetical protein